MTALTHSIVHLTDTHLKPRGVLVYDAVDTAANLQGVLDRIPDAAPHATALLLTGDLANDGEEGAYELLKELVDKAAADLGIPAYYGIGNHDAREPFRRVLFDGAAAPVGTVAGTDIGEGPLTRPIDYVIDHDGLRIVMVDSTDPGHHHGVVTDAQYAWLDEVFATPAPAGTILTIHHPPFPIPAGTDESILMESASFRGVERFTEFIARRRGVGGLDLVVCGHYHEPMAASIGGAAVWAGPSTAMGHEVSLTDDSFALVAKSGMAVIDRYDNGQIIARAVDCLERPVHFSTTLTRLRELVMAGGH